MIFYGRNIVLEAIRSKHKCNLVVLQEGITETQKIINIVSEARAKNIPIKYIPRKEISFQTKSEEHQGVYIIVEYKFFNLKDLAVSSKNQAFIYITTATFEHNIGAISRSAEVAGLSGVIIPKNAEITPTVAKTSAGAIFHIPIIKLPVFNAIKTLKDEGFFIFGIERDGVTYYKNNLSDNSLFIIGGEDKSLSDSVRSKCDEILEIPQAGKVNSLNMSVAASIVLFERNRQINS